MSDLPPFAPRAVALSDRWVRLEPLARATPEEFLDATRGDPCLFRYMPTPTPGSVDEARAILADAAAREAEGSQLAFAVRAQPDGRLAGSTRYLDIRPAHRGLEIGFTWVSPAFQRSAVNTAAKLLLLEHAFAGLGALRVQLKTDLRNERSQRAIERLGAVREGVLRQHMRLPDGHVRDTVMYSIVRAEWPALRARLAARLERG